MQRNRHGVINGKHHIFIRKLHTLKIKKFYVNMQVFYTARNNVQVYSMQQHKNIFRFDSFFCSFQTFYIMYFV